MSSLSSGRQAWPWAEAGDSSVSSVVNGSREMIDKEKTKATGIEIAKLIGQHMVDVGAELYYHKFQPRANQFHPLHLFSSITSTLDKQDNSSCTSFGLNSVGIIRVPHGDGKESIVLVNGPKCNVFKRAGTIAAALVFKIVTEEERDCLTIHAEASNGQMPNLDLAVHGQAAEYVEGTATLASSIYYQAIGVPTESHGAFRDYQVDAVTLELSPRFPHNSDNSRYAFLLRSGRLIEGVILSVNNLLEKFHQSFFLYLLTAPHNSTSEEAGGGKCLSQVITTGDLQFSSGCGWVSTVALLILRGSFGDFGKTSIEQILENSCYTKPLKLNGKNAWSFSKSYSSRATEEVYAKDFPFKMTPERKRGSNCSDRALF
ncbi:hypothetical protein OPV22_020529 [Ensete ventricosum]|uniref:Uncharacterized protein n=1 Tax=Ensete ventricosum TaxID=4639 RepID=A0AAV8QF11_ENSVE|nr:hypothetical protein OPV22_020529 [Ensete ventricosum]